MFDSLGGTREDDGIDRRGVLKATGAGLAAAAAVPGLASAQEDADFRLGGEVAAWHGRAPSSIEGEDNPTLELEAGKEYTLVWENMDGQPHNFVTLDSGGNQITASEIMSKKGETQTVTFTATAEMTQYYCQVHPSSMVGDLEVSGSGGGSQSGNATTTETASGNQTEMAGGNETETATEESTEMATETPTEATSTPTGTAESGGESGGGSGGTETDGSGPGFGVGTAAAALGAGALVEKFRNRGE